MNPHKPTAMTATRLPEIRNNTSKIHLERIPHVIFDDADFQALRIYVGSSSVLDALRKRHVASR